MCGCVSALRRDCCWAGVVMRGSVAGVPPQAKAEQEGGAAAGPPNWLDEGLSALQAKGATKTASGTFVFDGPSWASLAIDDPDASSS